MNKEIKVFVAGAKGLRDERNTLKVLANDLSTRYQSKGYSVVIYSYENLDDDQGSYNSFIKSQADIVLFVVADGIGARTEEEFREATTIWNNEGHPEVIVFVKATKEVTPGIARFEGLMQGRLSDRYHVDYTDLKDLRAEAKERLIRYIDERIEKDGTIGNLPPKFNDSEQPEMPIRKSKRQKTVSISRIWITALAAAVLVLVVALIFILTRPPKTAIMFAGGGSAAKYILQKTGIDIFDYEGSVYANMPSGNAWSLLSEEYYRYVRAGRPDQGPSFVTLCVSAGEADMTALLKTCDSKTFQNEASVVECLLGYDTLTVYIEKNLYHRLKKENIVDSPTEISPYQVAALISRWRVMDIFCTSSNSGTLRSYQKCVDFDKSIIIDTMLREKQLIVFNEASEISDFIVEDSSAWKPFVILGSTSYFVDILEEEQNKIDTSIFYSMHVRDTSSSYVKKGIYLYFVAFKDIHSKNQVIIPKPIWDFFNREGMANIVGEECLNQIKDRKITTGGLVTRLNSRAFMETNSSK